MPLVSSKSPADRSFGTLNNVISRINGDLTLTPTNLFNNWGFFSLDNKGDPEGLDVGMPEEPDGWYVYLSEKNAGPETMTAQNAAPLPIERASFLTTQARVTGSAPMLSQFAAPIAPPMKPSVQNINNAQGGYAAGTYWVSYNYHARDRTTAVAPAVQVTVGQGQQIRITMPSSIPDTVTGIGIWLSSTNGGPETMREQRIVDIRRSRPRTYVLSGPFRLGAGTGTNNTTLPAPNAPIVRLVYAPTTLKAGTYKFTAIRVTSGGVSSQSTQTETITVPPGGYPNTAIELTPIEPSYGVVTQHYIVAYINGEEHILFNATMGSELKPLPVNQPIVTDGTVKPSSTTTTSTNNVQIVESGTQGVFVSITGSGNRVSIKQTITQNSSTTTRTTTGGTGGGGGGGGGDTPAPTPGTGENQTEDETEDPQNELDPPVAEGLVQLEPGTYWVALAYAVRGDETVVSAPTKFTFTTGQLPRIVFPDMVNAIVNSTLRERDATNKPLDHTLTAGSGTATVTVDSTVRLDTNGAHTGSTVSPSHNTTFDINRNITYKMQVVVNANILQGSVNVDIEELDANNTILRVTTIKSITGTGLVTVRYNLGPEGTITWINGAEKARLVTRFTGATRQGSVDIGDFLAKLGISGIRRRMTFPWGERLASITDIPKWWPWPRTSHKGTEKPPPTPVTPKPPPLQSSPDIVDFNNGQHGPGWVVQQLTTSGSVSEIITGAKIEGTHGWHINKTTASNATNYIRKDFGPSTRTRMAVHAWIQVKQLPTSSTVDLLNIGDNSTNWFASLYLNSSGQLYYWAMDKAGINYHRIVASGILANDILDVELRVDKVGTNHGLVDAAYGKNGAPRSWASALALDWSWTRRSTRAYAGASTYGDPASKWAFYYDRIVVTDSGDPRSTGPLGDPVIVPPPLEPVPLPDRPPMSGVVIEEQNFNDGTTGSWVTTRTPSDSTTTASVTNAAAIDGSHGLRISDTGTSTASSVYVQRTLATGRNTTGVRAKYRINTRPNSGSVDLMQLRGPSDEMLGRAYIDSSGSLWAQPYSANVGHSAQRIAENVTNGTIFTLELVASNAGSTSGNLQAYVERGSTGLPGARTLLLNSASMNWSSYTLQRIRLGGIESAAATTFNMDVDSVVITEAGEVQFREIDSKGRAINQLHVFYTLGQPARDDLLLQNYREAVVPGQTYTAAIWARYSGVRQGAQPCYFTAYTPLGEAKPLGSLFGDNPVSGSSDWVDRVRTFAIPANCYEVRMDSRGVGEGEWCLQEFAFSPGGTAIREVAYPTTGSAAFSLNTQVANSAIQPMGRPWRSTGVITEAPTGSTAAVTYRSSDMIAGPFSPWTSDPLTVPQAKYAHYSIAMTSDGSTTPVVRGGTPYVDYSFTVGRKQVATLMREDRTEFDGGIILTEVHVPYGRSLNSVKMLPSGRVSRVRMGNPVGRIPTFKIGAFTEDAAREIQETCLDRDFTMEVRDRVYRVRFSQQLEFRAVPGAWRRRLPDEWDFWGVAESGDVEIMEWMVRPI